MSDLKARLMQPAMTSHFQCWFNAPPPVQSWIRQRQRERLGAAAEDPISSLALENLSLSCCDASLPGSTFQTHDVISYTGVNEKFAYMRAYDDRSDFTFYVNEQYQQLQFFEDWMAYIVDEQYNEDNRGGLGSDTYNYRMNFPKNYRGGIKISKFERSYGGEKTNSNQKIGRTLEYYFKSAYPISMTSIPVSYNSSELLKCTVSFTYSRYYLGSNSLGGITLPTASTNQGTVPTSQGATNEIIESDLLGENFFRELA
jgi:hypothetical protein